MATAPKMPVVTTLPESETRLSESATFEGHWKGGDVVVQGRFEGELTLTGRLRVGRTGSVLGRVRADVVELGGEFTGEIQARLIKMNEYARARGTFASELLVVMEGAVVDGAFDKPKKTFTTAGTAPIVRPIADKAKPVPLPPTSGDAPKPAGSGADTPKPTDKPAESESGAPKEQG